MATQKRDPHETAVSATIQSMTENLAQMLRDEFPYLKTAAINRLISDASSLVRDQLDEQATVMSASKERVGFFSLPAKISNNIHELVLEPDERCVQSEIMRTKGRTLPGHRWSQKYYVVHDFGKVDRARLAIPPIARVSKRFRSETLPIFFGLNTWVAYMSPRYLPRKVEMATFAMRDWLNMIGSGNACLIKRFIVRVPLAPCDYNDRSDAHLEVCPNWHPSGCLSVAEVLGCGQQGLKDAAFKVEIGTTIHGTFWSFTSSTEEEMKQLEWRPLD